MRIIYETEDGKIFYDMLSAQKHEEKLDLSEIKGVEMYDVCGKKLEINSISFRQASKIVINDINDLPRFKKKIKPYVFSGEEEGTWIKVFTLDIFNSKWVKSRTKEEIARLVKNGNKADIYIRNGEYCALVDDEI